MTTLHLTGWRSGLQTVSLTVAVKEYSTGSLVAAKREVERLLAGESIMLPFEAEDWIESVARGYAR